MKIAIIGAGISGLVAAHKLHADHEIVVFEAQSKPGGHTNTVRVDLDGESHLIDTGFIVFNDWTYPNFIRLLDELGIASRPTTMGFSVHDAATGIEYAGHSLNALFARRSNLLSPGFYRMLVDILRFNREARRMTGPDFDRLTVRMFLERGRYSEFFARWHLLPMGAAIWSCAPGTFAEFPIRFVAEFYRNHGLLNVRHRPVWRVIEGGSKTYVDALIRPFRDRIRLNSPVVSIRRGTHRVDVAVRERDFEPFDQVIFACHSDQALRILGDGATPAEREILGRLPYGRNSAVLHTDIRMLPKNRRAWASWNYRVSSDDNTPASVTYNMNILQGIRSKNTFCVTLNDQSQIDPARILGRFEYYHPVFTVERDSAQARIAELLNANRTSFCGAYWRNGFHEDGVVSALNVVEALTASRQTTSSLVRVSEWPMMEVPS